MGGLGKEFGVIAVAVGAIIILIGLLLIFKIPIPLGRLPGDIYISTGKLQFYFPFTTCILVSVIISFILYLFTSR